MTETVAFVVLHHVALFVFVFMFRHARRRFFRCQPPLGRRTLKRLKQQAPQVLARALRKCAEMQSGLDGFCSWMYRHRFYLRIGYAYYSGVCSTTWKGWLSAAFVLAPFLQRHAPTLLECQLLSVCSNCEMAEGRLVQSFFGCVLAVGCPWFPPSCSRCGGNHSDEQCPHYSAPKDTHNDAWMHYDNPPAASPDAGNNLVLRGARICKQPGDGHCLFHSLGIGLQVHGKGMSAISLRQEICDFFCTHANEVYGESNTWRQWIEKEAGVGVTSYCSRMRASNDWGGNLEIAACSVLKKVNIHVYRILHGELRRTTCVTSPVHTEQTIQVLYTGMSHYDLLEGGCIETSEPTQNDASRGSSSASGLLQNIICIKGFLYSCYNYEVCSGQCLLIFCGLSFSLLQKKIWLCS